MNIPGLLRRYLPILDWGARYTGKTFTNDLIVAGIVTVMLNAARKTETLPMRAAATLGRKALCPGSQ